MIILNTENKLKLEIIYNVISSIIYDYRVTLNLTARYRIEFSCDKNKGIVSAIFLDNDEEIVKCIMDSLPALLLNTLIMM